ncbi:MAG: type II toxin-antitoxin system ParD family antitoxin [Steroidobacteraceae bacterium]
MATIEKISVALPADMLNLVKQAVKSGDYATTSEVIREALREWKGRRETREETIAEVRRLVQEGLDSGGWHPPDTEEIKRAGRRRLARMKAAKGQRGR